MQCMMWSHKGISTFLFSDKKKLDLLDSSLIYICQQVIDANSDAWSHLSRLVLSQSLDAISVASCQLCRLMEFLSSDAISIF